MIAQGLQPYLKSRQDIDFQFLGLPTVLHATTETTGGRFGLMEHATIPPGFASPYHTHHDEDEAFYVLEGQMRFVCGGKWMSAGAGTWVYGPREIPHGFKVVGSRPARMLLMCAPAGFEKFALQLSAPAGAPSAPPDMARLMAAAAQFNVDILGPLPEDTDVTDRAADAIQQAVDRSRAQHVAAVNAGDVDAATNLFAPDAIFLPPGAPALEGTAAIRAWFTQVFGKFTIKDFGLQPVGRRAGRRERDPRARPLEGDVPAEGRIAGFPAGRLT